MAGQGRLLHMCRGALTVSASPPRQSGEEREEGQEEQKDGEEMGLRMNLIKCFLVKVLGGLGRKLVERGSRCGWEGGLGHLSHADVYLNPC